MECNSDTANAFDEVSSVSDSDASRLDEENELDSLILLGIQFKNDCGLYCGSWQHAESLSSIFGPSPHFRESKATLETNETPLKKSIL